MVQAIKYFNVLCHKRVHKLMEFKNHDLDDSKPKLYLEVQRRRSVQYFSKGKVGCKDLLEKV